MRQARRIRDRSIIQHTRAERSTGSYVAEHTDSTWTQTFPGVFLGACRGRAISGVPASQQPASKERQATCCSKTQRLAGW